MLKRYPLHPLLLAVYPVLTMLGNNITEVSAIVVIRPLLISLAAAGVVLVSSYLILRNWLKSALVTSLLFIAFFSYGHVYLLAKELLLFGVSVGRHRFLGVIYGVGLFLGLFWIIKKLKDLETSTNILNLISGLLVIFSLAQLAGFYNQASKSKDVSAMVSSKTTSLTIQNGEPLPDIYYIILDGYTRQDALQRDLDFDNTPFIEELRSLGFYVPDCSRSNYSFTLASLTTALNMVYLPELNEILVQSGINKGSIWLLLHQNQVRKQLEAIGYQTVAFDTGYKWSRLEDAAYYIGLEQDTVTLQLITPFEALLIKSTALKILLDSQRLFFLSSFQQIVFPFQEHVDRQLYNLDQLSKVPEIASPTFTFLHLLIPHVPYVFGPDGKIRTDPGFFSGKRDGPITEEYLRKGYIGQIVFVNHRILDIVKHILATSDISPIIIIQGDHGLKNNNRLQILNAYYLPNEGANLLYTTITPVNTFRIVFDAYFNTNYGLLPDKSFFREDYATIVQETAPGCLATLP